MDLVYEISQLYHGLTPLGQTLVLCALAIGVIVIVAMLMGSRGG